MTTHQESVDVLAIGAHPDDVELGCGGLLAKLSSEGKRIAILDLTRGELSTRGTPNERHAESEHAAAILGLCARENAGLPDGGLSNTPEQRLAVIPFIRRFRPKVVLTLMTPDRHPDHEAAHYLGRDACFLSGLMRIDTGQEPFRPERIYYFHPYLDAAASPFGIVDISGFFPKKLASIGAHKTQFYNPDDRSAGTYISSLEFWESIEHRARFWGRRIGVCHGEALYSEGPVSLSTLPGL
ncbi:MAG TPA: bacillithiol biosynthesis deacetylase BshB1 [Candidatus Hydrogenedentes bacterium]|nr:bacillithiol biosynthesis deacetylase BshB1 [Candidatus Hydrogenedentota bacterium]